MPGMNGFELRARVSHQPIVIFTTAFDQYALRAFEVNSIDYLLKRIEQHQLERAIFLSVFARVEIEERSPTFPS
jgi:two-component system, LytTR family, response regulator